MRGKLLRILSAVCGTFVVLGIILNCVNFFCFQKSFYQREYQKLDTAEQIGMSGADLQAATDALLDYLRGRREDLHVQAIIGGQQREVFNQREILHMADVRTLYLWAMRIGNGLLILAAAFYLWAWIGGRDKAAVLGGYLQRLGFMRRWILKASGQAFTKFSLPTIYGCWIPERISSFRWFQSNFSLIWSCASSSRRQ